MPLTRASVTAASRIMLPAYLVHSLFFGMLYALDPGGRYDRAPGLAFARLMMPLWAWGAVLLTCAACMAAALYLRQRMLMVGVLFGYAAVNVLWAGIYAGAPFVSPDASFGGPGHPLLIATACIASGVSLLAREV